MRNFACKMMMMMVVMLMVCGATRWPMVLPARAAESIYGNSENQSQMRGFANGTKNGLKKNIAVRLARAFQWNADTPGTGRDCPNTNKEMRFVIATAKTIEQAKRTLTLSLEDKELVQDFRILLDRIRDRVRGVAEKYQNGTYLVGRAGASKTFTVLEQLKALDVPWAYRNSRMSTWGLFTFLETHPEHVCVIDDISTLFKQPQALQIIMAALGGDIGQPRPVHFAARNKNERKSFQFNGGIIAISNVPLHRDPLADAVASRIPMLEHEPSDQMMEAFMRYLALRGYEDLSPSECLLVTSFVIEKSRDCDRRLDLRSLSKGLNDYRLDKHGKANRSWRELIESSMKQVFTEEEFIPMGRTHEQARSSEIALDLFRRFPRDREAREAEWTKRTGKSSTTLYRCRQKLQAAGRL